MKKHIGLVLADGLERFIISLWHILQWETSSAMLVPNPWPGYPGMPSHYHQHSIHCWISLEVIHSFCQTAYCRSGHGSRKVTTREVTLGRVVDIYQLGLVALQWRYETWQAGLADWYLKRKQTISHIRGIAAVIYVWLQGELQSLSHLMKPHQWAYTGQEPVITIDQSSWSLIKGSGDWLVICFCP